MGKNDVETADRRLAERLRSLRASRGWSLDQLAAGSSVSRATLSRLENGEVSPTAQVLGRLCAAYGLPVSRLMRLVEGEAAALVRAAEQESWVDPGGGFRRQLVSPPAEGLSGEVVGCTLEAGVRIDYEHSPRAGLEHHLVMRAGVLDVTVEGTVHRLQAGDCLRYQLHGPSSFATPPDAGASYFIFLV